MTIAIDECLLHFSSNSSTSSINSNSAVTKIISQFTEVNNTNIACAYNSVSTPLHQVTINQVIRPIYFSNLNTTSPTDAAGHGADSAWQWHFFFDVASYMEIDSVSSLKPTCHTEWPFKDSETSLDRSIPCEDMNISFSIHANDGYYVTIKFVLAVQHTFYNKLVYPTWPADFDS
jgi:hypothetical protein